MRHPRTTYRKLHTLYEHSLLLSIPPGHYYSPVPDRQAVHQNRARLFDTSRDTIPGIELQLAEQSRLLAELAEYARNQPFQDESQEGLRYFFKNEMFPDCDGLLAHCLLRHLKPSRVIEVGSGWSSFLMLDTADRFLGGKVQFTFIEPDDQRLRSRLKADDQGRTTIINSLVQDVDPGLFDALEPGDILFIDSSHVGKIGSDVMFLFGEILPRLKADVIVHVHDIFYPFEYPEEWVAEGRFWNEAYLLRMFLAYNSAFRILLWNHHLQVKCPAELNRAMGRPLTSRGGSIWLTKHRD